MSVIAKMGRAGMLGGMLAGIVMLTSCVISGAIAKARHERELKNYQGDGKITLMSRTYGLGITNYGFVLELPEFNPVRDVSAEYQLVNLPPWGPYPAQMQIVISNKEKKRVTPEEAKAIRERLPDVHEIHCALIEKSTGKVIQEIKSKVGELKDPRIWVLNRGPLVLPLFEIDMKQLPEPNEMVLKMEYKTNGAPFDYLMTVVVYREAPTM